MVYILPKNYVGMIQKFSFSIGPPQLRIEYTFISVFNTVYNGWFSKHMFVKFTSNFIL